MNPQRRRSRAHGFPFMSAYARKRREEQNARMTKAMRGVMTQALLAQLRREDAEREAVERFARVIVQAARRYAAFIRLIASKAKKGSE